MMKQILLALLLAVVCYAAGGFLPGDVRQLLQQEIIQPVFSKITAVIATVATPLVFLAVIDGILGMGSTSALGAVGKRLITNMLACYAIAAAAFSALSPLFYSLHGGGRVSAGGVVGQLLQLVLDIIPDHLLACFAEDNALQVIAVAIFIGVIMLMLGSRMERVAEGLRTLSVIVNKMMTVICRLLPFMVFLGVLNMLLNDRSQFAEIYKVILLFLLSSAVVLLSLMVRVRLTAGVSPLRLLKAQLKTLMINLTTSSQVAAMPENICCCKEAFGIDSKFVDFALPIAIVVYMPCGAAFLGLTCWGTAAMSGAAIDLIFILKTAFVAVVVAIAAPPIPGSVFAVLPILFKACGISMDYYSLAIVLGTLIGYFLPALNGYAMQLELLITAKQLGLTDEGKLAAFRRK